MRRRVAAGSSALGERSEASLGEDLERALAGCVTDSAAVALAGVAVLSVGLEPTSVGMVSLARRAAAAVEAAHLGRFAPVEAQAMPWGVGRARDEAAATEQVMYMAAGEARVEVVARGVERVVGSAVAVPTARAAAVATAVATGAEATAGGVAEGRQAEATEGWTVGSVEELAATGVPAERVEGVAASGGRAAMAVV